MKVVKGSLKKCLIVIFLIAPIVLVAQEKKKLKPVIKWNVTSQIWLRYSDLNAGSLVNGEATNSFTDISIRRLRKQFFAHSMT